MPYLKLSESELREVAKRNVETLEFWLRRIVHEGLIQAGGERYWETEGLIRAVIKDKVSERVRQVPVGRFPRWIDATLVEHLIEFICKPNLYSQHYRPYFAKLFPENFSSGKEYLEFILKKWVLTRNAVYHANPISARQVEQMSCYANDIIDSIKQHYVETNQHMSFNVPSIIAYSDSRGKRVYFEADDPGKRIRLNNKEAFRVGDRVKMAVEIDASYEPDSYEIEWKLIKGSWPIISNIVEVEVEFTEELIGALQVISVRIISNQTWHKYADHEDELRIVFDVLPPVD